MDRKYSVYDIDAMRKAVERFGWMANSGSYYPADRAKEIEERVRTYMVAGVDPDELKDDLEKIWEADFAYGNEIVGEQEYEGKIWKIHRNGQMSRSEVEQKLRSGGDE